MRAGKYFRHGHTGLWIVLEPSPYDPHRCIGVDHVVNEYGELVPIRYKVVK